MKGSNIPVKNSHWPIHDTRYLGRYLETSLPPSNGHSDIPPSGIMLSAWILGSCQNLVLVPRELYL